MHLDKRALTPQGCLPLILFWLVSLAPVCARAGEVQTKVLSTSDAAQTLGAGYLIQFSFGLILVLTTVLALAWLLRRINRLHASANGALRLLGVLSLGTRERVILIQVGQTQLLLGVAPGSIRTLHVMGDPVSGAVESFEKTAQGAAFPRLFNAALKRGTKKGAGES